MTHEVFNPKGVSEREEFIYPPHRPEPKVFKVRNNKLLDKVEITTPGGQQIAINLFAYRGAIRQSIVELVETIAKEFNIKVEVETNSTSKV